MPTEEYNESPEDRIEREHEQRRRSPRKMVAVPISATLSQGLYRLFIRDAEDNSEDEEYEVSLKTTAPVGTRQILEVPEGFGTVFTRAYYTTPNGTYLLVWDDRVFRGGGEPPDPPPVVVRYLHDTSTGSNLDYNFRFDGTFGDVTNYSLDVISTDISYPVTMSMFRKGVIDYGNFVVAEGQLAAFDSTTGELIWAILSTFEEGGPGGGLVPT